MKGKGGEWEERKGKNGEQEEETEETKHGRNRFLTTTLRISTRRGEARYARITKWGVCGSANSTS